MIMKKALFLVCFMLFSTTVSYAQSKSLSDYLTDEEKEVTEKDLDNAFVAPSSKFIGKKWYIEKNLYNIFNANGTLKNVQIFSDDDYGDPIEITRTISGSWKRDKQYLNLTYLAKTTTYTPNPSGLKKFSLRKQDEIKRDWANTQKAKREYGDGRYQWELLKLTNDYMIIHNSNGRLHLFSKKKLDELYKKAAENNEESTQ